MTGPRLFATLDGYAVEGGYDLGNGLATCYAPSIALGRIEGPGDAAGLWRDYEVVLDHAARLGLDGVRLSIEWTRVEPRRGVLDEGALSRYVDVVDHARGLGLAVTVVLVDAVWPLWTGLEAWLLPWVERYAVAHGRRVAAALTGATGVIVATRPADLVNGGFLDGTVPPFRVRADADARSAHGSLDRIVATLREDPAIEPRLVDSWREASLDATRVAPSGVDELHLRGLVAGAGPTAAPVGLLVRGAGGWTDGPAVALLDTLR